MDPPDAGAPEPPGPEPDVADLFLAHRQRAMDVAYRLLGSVSEAEDAVQDAYLRLLAADVAAIDDVRGWLVTVTSRLCLDRLRRHEHQRRAYVGPWLPEPLVGPIGGPDAVADRVTLDESVRMALLVVLEQLTPAERTAFVLHDVFSVPFDEVGAIVGRSPQACRQLASRARRHLAAAGDAPRRAVASADAEAVVRRFAAACTAGDLEGLVAVLADEVVGDFDAGGVLPGAPTTELDGAEVVAGQLLGSLPAARVAFEVVAVNGDPGLLATVAGRGVVAVLSLGVHDGRVDTIRAVGNPAKLAHVRLPWDGPEAPSRSPAARSGRGPGAVTPR